MEPPAAFAHRLARRQPVTVGGSRSARDRSAPERKGRSASVAGPFWITLAVAAVLAGGLWLALAEQPPEAPAEVVLLVDGLR